MEGQHVSDLNNEDILHVIIEADGNRAGYAIIAGLKEANNALKRIVIVEKGMGFGRASVERNIKLILDRRCIHMNKSKIMIAVLILILIIASLLFYNVVINREAPNFKEGIVMPQGIAIYDKEIYDSIVVKTIVMEIEKSPLEKATKRDQDSIEEIERAFSIRAIYNKEDPQSGRLNTIEVLTDGTFIASKNVNGREQYVKGKFGPYTLNYLTGLYTLE